MRSCLLFLALTLVVATVSAEDSFPKKFVNRGKGFYVASKKFFTEDPLGQRIIKFLKDVKATVTEGRNIVRERIAQYIRDLKAEAQ